MTRIIMLASLVLMASAGLAAAQDQQTIRPQALKAVRAACGADVRKLCAGIQPGGGRILQCMRDHQAELSADCQTALASAAAQR